MVSTYRYDGDEIDSSLALSEAKILHNAIKEKAFGHEEIIRILSTRSKAQVNATFNCYKDEYGASITKVWMLNQSEKSFLKSSPFVSSVMLSYGKEWSRILCVSFIFCSK